MNLQRFRGVENICGTKKTEKLIFERKWIS